MCGTHFNYFDGYWHNPAKHSNTLEGASAYIVNQFGSVCDTIHSAPNPGQQTVGSNVSTAWVMIAAFDGVGWAQDGFIRGYLSPTYEFAQFYNPVTQAVYNRFPANPSIPNGAKHAYRDLYKQSCGCIVMSIDGTELTQTNFNPYGTWYAGPNGDQFSPEFLGETNYTQSDMPGLPSSKTAFSGLGAQQFTNDTLGSMPCTMNGANDNPSRWTYSASSCTAFDIWTYNTG